MKKLVALLVSLMMLFTTCACAEGMDLVIADVAVSMAGEAVDVGNPVVRLGYAEDEAGNIGLRLALEEDEVTSVEAIIAGIGEQLIIASNALPEMYYINLPAVMEELVEEETATEDTSAQEAAVDALITAALPAVMNFAAGVEMTEQDTGFAVTVSAEALNTLKNDLAAALNAEPDAVKTLGLEEVVAELAAMPDGDISLQGILAMDEAIVAELDILSAGEVVANLYFEMTAEETETDLNIAFELSLNAFDGEEKLTVLSIDGVANMISETEEITYVQVNFNLFGEVYTLVISDPVDEEGLTIAFFDDADTLSFNMIIGGADSLLDVTLLDADTMYVLSCAANEDESLSLIAGALTAEGEELFSAVATVTAEENDGAWLALDTTNAVDLMTLLTNLTLETAGTDLTLEVVE